MHNFRQFIGKQVITFATSADKNITIIIGENGSGKTTLAQAFLWVLYGETEFKIKEVINRSVRDNMSPGEEQVVKVDLYINHNNIDYTISKKQIFKRDYTNIKTNNAELTIAYNRNGQQEFLKPHETLSLIKTILPQELSKFFFFDGERIKAMSDEIERGKSKEFADAVRGLVGLTAIMNAINHLKPSTTVTTVIGRYNNKIDEGGNEKIANYGREICKLQDELTYIEKRLDEIEPQIEFYRLQSIELNQKIGSYAEAEKIQSEYTKVTSEINRLKIVKKDAVKTFLSVFNKNTPSFLEKPIIQKALAELAHADKVDKDIPNINQKTIEYLLKRGYCLCGTKLIPNTEGFSEVCKLIDYVPPKALGTIIGEFVKDSKSKAKQAENYHHIFYDLFSRIREIDEKVEVNIKLQTQLNNSLLDTSMVAGLKKRQLEAEEKVKQLTSEQKEKLELKGKKTSEKERKETERNQLILVDEKNKEYEGYRQYAYAVYEELLTAYQYQEKIYREDLQSIINEIFTQIYEGGISICVDEKYNIKVSVAQSISKDDLERSTAQSYSVIFSFIAGIIKMAKQKSMKDSNLGDKEDSIFNEAAGYPLVMDAPLSAFDKKRIKNICYTLPQIAQQVIFFIKDTDGEVAEQHLGKIIGNKYFIKKVSLVESKVCEVI